MSGISKRYKTTSGFKLDREEGPWIARAGTSKAVLDDFVASLAQICDGRDFDSLYRELNAQTVVARPLLEASLNVLAAAGFIDVIPEPDVSNLSNETIPPSGEPLVTIVILSHDGQDHLRELLPSIEKQSHKNLQTIVVDNDSTDGTADMVHRGFPFVEVIEAGSALNFSQGNNVGIKAARGDYVFILNNDTVLEQECVKELLAAARARKGVAAVAARMMFYDNPRFLNSLGNSISPYTWGSDNFIGYLDIGQFNKVKAVFSACFGAVLIPREVFSKVGLLDPGYGFYYEDSDWSYRARMLGYRIIAAPKAVVYHKFSASMKKKSFFFKIRMAAKNRLRFAIKNLEPVNALWFIRNYVWREDIRNIARHLIKGEISGVLAYARAYGGLILSLPRLVLLRAAIQRGRLPKMKDDNLLAAIESAPPQMSGTYPLITKQNIREHYMHTRSAS